MKPNSGMEPHTSDDNTNTKSAPKTDKCASGISLSVEENEMVFYILKELDLFLESEESLLKKELTILDASFETKINLSDKILDDADKGIRTKELNGFTDNSDPSDERAEDIYNPGNKNVETNLKKELETRQQLEVNTRTNRYKQITTMTDLVVEIDDDDDEDEDDALDGSFGMPMADACAECYHTHIEYALSNSVRNSHVTCLQAILEQLFQTREVAKKQKQRNIKRRANSGESHILECNNECVTDEDMEPNLSASPLLLEAITRGHAQVVHLILKCLEDLNQLHDSLLISDSAGLRPVHLAAYLNHTTCLELLLQNTPVKREFWRDKHERTPLLVAVQCLKRLMTVDDVGATSKTGATAVCLAAEAGSVGCLEVLIEQGTMDPTVGDDAGMTPLHFAAEAGHLNCTHWLVRRATCSLNVQRKRDGANPMHLAAAKGRCPIIQWALNRELSRGDELDYFGRTPVHYAAEEGQMTALKTFAKFVKVDLFAKDFLGRTPSHLAERRGYLGCVRYLDSCSKHKRSDGERPGKISRSLSTSNVNKLVRRGSGRRSAKRREISSVYVDGPSPVENNGSANHVTLEAYLSGRKSGSIIPKMVTHVGLMSLATVLPDVGFLKGIMTRSESADVKSEGTGTLDCRTNVANTTIADAKSNGKV